MSFAGWSHVSTAIGAGRSLGAAPAIRARADFGSLLCKSGSLAVEAASCASAPLHRVGMATMRVFGVAGSLFARDPGSRAGQIGFFLEYNFDHFLRQQSSFQLIEECADDSGSRPLSGDLDFPILSIKDYVRSESC